MAQTHFCPSSSLAAMSRRRFVAGIGAAALVGAASPVTASAADTIDSVQIDPSRRTLRFTRPVQRRDVARILRRQAVPHRWVAPDSLELHEWTIATPQHARGFGWSSLDADGRVIETWAEFVVLDASDRAREFEIVVGDDVLETSELRLNARVDGYPPVCLRDLPGRLRPRDHVNLLAKAGPIARSHRLVAVA